MICAIPIRSRSARPTTSSNTQPKMRSRRYELGGELRIPQRDQRQRDEPTTAGATAPLVDHPVVVDTNAREAELSVGVLEERLTAEAGERRERERRFGVVGVEVLEPGGLVPGAGTHVLVRHRVPVLAEVV